MAIPAEQLNQWADDLDNEISVVETQIQSLQEKLTELQAKRTALAYLTGSIQGGHGNKLEATALVTSKVRQRRAWMPPLNTKEHAPQSAYRLPILEALEEVGGKGHVQEILPRVKLKMETNGLLRRGDYGDVPSGSEEYWRNLARWERMVMVNLGLLRPESPRGIWEITNEGREWLQRRTVGGKNVKKTISCGKCSRTIQIEGPANNSKEVPQQATCPFCKHPNEVMWPMAGGYKVSAKA